MTGEERALVVLLRQTEWLCDELAYGIPAGRVGAERRKDAADVLSQVAELLRAGAGGMVIDG